MSSQKFEGVIDDICGLNWRNLVEDDLVSVAWVYDYFSVQFRESSARLHASSILMTIDCSNSTMASGIPTTFLRGLVLLQPESG